MQNEKLKIKTNIPLKDYTTLKIGGRAKYFFEAKTKKELIEAIKFARQKKLPFFILGGGSNLLVSDKGFDGLVIKFQVSSFKFQDNKIFAEAGVELNDLVKLSAENNLTGLEWAAGIPGTVGGAIYGNAAAFEQSMKDIVKSVEVFDVSKNTGVGPLQIKDCRFGYKESVFKKNKNLIILSCVLGLKKGNKKDYNPPTTSSHSSLCSERAPIKKKIKYFLNQKKKTQPLKFLSAGCIFKNPKNISAGELIEKCGLKGKRIGRAMISEEHANFIVNLGKARSEDVLRLINLIKKKVKNKFGIELKEEIQFLGF